MDALGQAYSQSSVSSIIWPPNKIMSKLIFLCLSSLVCFSKSQEICNTYCDGRDSSLVSNDVRVITSAQINGRTISLLLSDTDNMAFATIDNGLARDEVWLDRSFDAGLTWGDLEPPLGFTLVPEGATAVSTSLFNIDHDAVRGLGAVRACGRGLTPSPGPLVCTEWARSKVHAETPIDAAATALMQYFDGQLFNTVGWWNGANALTAMIQYMKFSGSRTHFHVIDTVYNTNLDEWDGNFTSDALDDTEWWALAWIDAYDLTGDQKYLDMAILDTNYILEYVDDWCGGGVWWNIYKTYKNAITNELLIQLTAALHNRLPGDTEYLNHAIQLWQWFKQTGMINGENLINDGLNDDCQNNGQPPWTYNQGVILSGLMELYEATRDTTYIREAVAIADAVLASPLLSRDQVLTEPCEYSGHVGCGNHTGGCDCNAISFKGIFMRHLGALNRVVRRGDYEIYIRRQSLVAYENNRNLLDQYGIHYAGPLEDIVAGTQQSALEAFTAAILEPQDNKRS